MAFINEDVVQSSAIDVENLKNADHPIHRKVPVLRPLDDVEVLQSGKQSIKDAVQKNWLIQKFLLQQAKITTIDLNPELGASHVFHPAVPQVLVPVLPTPLLNRRGTEVPACSFAFDPFVLESFCPAAGVDTLSNHGRSLPPPQAPRRWATGTILLGIPSFRNDTSVQSEKAPKSAVLFDCIRAHGWQQHLFMQANAVVRASRLSGQPSFARPVSTTLARTDSFPTCRRKASYFCLTRNRPISPDEILIF